MGASTYKFIHLCAIIIFFFSMGGLIQGAWAANNRQFSHKKVFSILHGIGLLLLLVSGFGQIAKLGLAHEGFPIWLIIKIIIWLLLGLLLSPILRKPLLNYYIWAITLILGCTAVTLAIFKPF